MSKVALKRCPDYDPERVYQSVSESINLLGGVSTFIKPGEKVLLKPNLLSAKPPEKAVTTHPAIVEAVIRLVKDSGATPFVGDSPGIGSAGQVAARSGIKEIADRYGVEIVNLSEGIRVENRKGRLFRRFEVSKAATEADAIINIPKLKTHAMMTMTLGVKNLFGCVPGKRKVSWHFEAGHDKEAFAKMLVELYQLLNPRLTILDGIVGMEGDGPGSGIPREMGIIAASSDAVAMDMIVSRMVGLEPEELPTTRAAMGLGVGEADPGRIEVVGDAAEMAFEDFVFPETTEPRFVSWLPSFIKRHMDQALTTKPVVNHDLCKLCSICVNACPPHVMEITDRLRINYDDCIRCYCCHELCPEGAIDIKKGWALKLLAS
jgi:uncharacterized protein (DUF362 family)/Pyruvate/2-oxoacid:ferredoxin oxidoreductase delta subunit